ncbi:helix-turn-helix domain-containing protein [Gemmatirosa kalamazoonensis]|uniref:helix-turn-helix domain-containing protein n=1 Tax=Gemmatirosa kalamazoonensis TaxID=861299 RepID=UPI0031B58C04
MGRGRDAGAGALSLAGERARAGEHRGAARDIARRRARDRVARARGAAGGRHADVGARRRAGPTRCRAGKRRRRGAAHGGAGRLRARADLARALAAAAGNVAEAARRLQTDRPSLYRRMKRLGISGP